MIKTQITHKDFDLVIEHEEEPFWDDTDKGYSLPKKCDYQIKKIELCGKRIKEIKLTKSILETVNEMLEDEYTPQFMR